MKKLLYAVILFFLIIGISYFVIAHEPTPAYSPERKYITDREDEIMTKFLLAKDSSVIEIPEGHFSISKSIIIDGIKNVTIRGKGMDKSVLSFKNQVEGAEGLRITNGYNIIVEDLSLEDASGDVIKAMDCDGLTFRRVNASATGKMKVSNPAYLFYPVLSKNILIEECVAIGASDAGIYVGQSTNVVIRNNKVYYNVAGIESENCGNVKIYGNDVHENVAGILAFDLPGLARYGNNVEIYNNKIYNNNIRSFAPKGSIVSEVPSGTGMLIMSSDSIYVHDNIFLENRTMDIAIASYLSVAANNTDTDQVNTSTSDDPATQTRLNQMSAQTASIGEEIKKDKNYNPYPRRIFIKNNHYECSKLFPTMHNDFGHLMLFASFMKHVNIVWDGARAEDYNLSDGSVKPVYKICIDEKEGTVFLDADVMNDLENLSKDLSKFKCEL
ncbi:MAG: parallel beta-helix repeat protein [Saprospiraceae bacterium]|jgi:parallel beta-helix repeat protein